MRGNLNFAQSLRQRLALLKGLSASETFQQLRERLVLTKGASCLMHELQKLGHLTAIVSGGFLPMAEHVRQQLGCTLCFANVLEEDDQGRLTGNVLGDIIDGARKRDILLEVAEKHGIPRERVVAVGDGANDIPMLLAAGTGIAFRAKPQVQATAPCCLNHESISLILPILGLETSLNFTENQEWD